MGKLNLGETMLNTHVFGRHCHFERNNVSSTCKAAMNHTNPKKNGKYVNMHLSAQIRAKILLEAGVKQVPKRV